MPVYTGMTNASTPSFRPERSVEPESMKRAIALDARLHGHDGRNNPVIPAVAKRIAGIQKI